MKPVTFILLLLSTVACKRTDGFENVLTRDSKSTFWIQKKVNLYKTLSYTNSQWNFYPDGNAICYLSSNEQVKGTPAIFNIESSSYYKWRYTADDSTLKICSDCYFKIKKYNVDTLWIEAMKEAENFLLIRRKER